MQAAMQPAAIMTLQIYELVRNSVTASPNTSGAPPGPAMARVISAPAMRQSQEPRP